MENPNISVIIPVYQAADTLIRCLNSVMAQEFNSYEVIIIDDGSTDDSCQIVDEYAHKYDNVVAMHQPNAGIATTRWGG